MDTNQKNRPEQRRQRPAEQQPRKAPASQAPQRQRPAQPQSAAQRRAVKHQQAQRQAAAQEQQTQRKPQTQRKAPAQTARRPASTAAAPKKRKTTPKSMFGGLKLPQLGQSNTARGKREQAARAAKLKAMKQEVNQKEQAQKTRRKVSKPRKPTQPIIYTAPATFNAHRLVMQLLTITAVVLAAIICVSIFFKVEVIEVSGAEVYDEWTIREASGIQEGDNLLTFSRGRAGGKIKAELQYVDKVRFGIKLPNTVIIDIEEFDVVYAAKASDGTYYLINSDGKVVDQTDGGTAGNYTKILGVTLSGPIIGEQARAAEEIVAAAAATQAAEDSTEETVPQVLITNQSRLETALRILRALELNGIVGEAASVNVADLSHIELWYGTRYQVNLGDENNMDQKIADMKGTISQLADYQTGMLDVSYDIWEDKVVYTPFE